MSTSLADTASQPSARRELIAPLWHTTVFVLFVLIYAFFERTKVSRLESQHITSRVPLYLFMIGFELVLVCYVWFLGVKPAGGSFLSLVGGQWKTVGDVLRDIGIAFVFWMVVITMLVGLRVVLGQNPQMLRAARIVSPQNTQEMILWACVALAAGTCEEFVFRGYLQKQFQAITGSDVAAVGLQAVVFGAAHSYQGVKGMITITVYGALFGILAVYRKSLRPGMIQHVMQDTSAGIIGALFLKRLGKTPAIFFF